MTEKTERTTAWHFLPDHGCLAHQQPQIKVVADYVYAVAGEIVICENGLHGSRRALDALQNAPGGIVCRTEHWGDVVEDVDKLASRYRRVVWLADATRVLHEFACWAAEQALDRMEASGGTVDPRSRAAIATKRRWLAGEASHEELAAANAAARDAAWDAARDAAWAAARDAAWDELNAELERRLLALAPEEASA